jgi:hypothetical protein
MTEPSFDAPRLTTMLVHAWAATIPSSEPAAIAAPTKRLIDFLFIGIVP